jgi:hypothetical protein
MTTSETPRPTMPNEIDPAAVAAIAAGSADELLHADFHAMDQLDSLPTSKELRDSLDETDNVVSIADAPSRREPGVPNIPKYDIEKQPETPGSDPMPPYGIERKVTFEKPKTILGRLAHIAMFGGSKAGTRAHGETLKDTEGRINRQSLRDRKDAVRNSLNPSTDEVVDGIANRTKVQRDLDKIFKK